MVEAGRQADKFFIAPTLFTAGMSPLRLRYIEVFQALMQTGSTQGAAEVLHTTQPSISKALAALERQLRLPLFVRTGTGLKPTADAYALMSEAGRVSEEVRNFQRVAGELQEGRAMQLSIHATPAIASNLLPRAVARYKSTWHNTKISLSVGRTDAVVGSVRNHLTDFGIVITSPEEEIGLVRRLKSSAMVCILPRGHRLAQQAAITPADLADEPLIAYRTSLGLGKLVDKAFADAGVIQRVETRVNHTGVICAIVDQGYGVAIVDSLSVALGNHPGLEVRPFLPECTMHVALVVSEQRPLSLQAERFVEVLRQCLDEFP